MGFLRSDRRIGAVGLFFLASSIKDEGINLTSEFDSSVLPHASARWLVRPSDRLRPLMFMVAGGLSVPVNIAARILFSRFVSFDVAVVAAHLCGMITAYLLNKFFVFEQTGRDVSAELLRFSLVNIVSVMQTWLVSTTVLKHVLPALGINSHQELAAHFVGLSSTAVTSYFGHKWLSFAKAPQG